MLKSVKHILSLILIILTVFAPIGLLPSAVTVSAATYDDLNSDSVFVKQQTAVTCTLASAAMLMRRTAICSGFSDWEYITEENIRETAWIDGLGLRWNYTCFGITVGHGYFSFEIDNKTEILNLLEQYPQGFVIYNTGSMGQSHAVLLCDYDENTDTFYVADPASNAPNGRIPLSESTIIGETQDEQLENISAYWYIVSPSVVVDSNGNYSADELPNDPDINIPGTYDPTDDLTAFDSSRKRINSYYVVSDETETGSALRQYPSGSSNVYTRVNKGTILFITYSGKNDFGATWCKTGSDNYIFSSNITPFEEYSAETVKFRNTAEKIDSTYSVNATNDTRTPLRLEPAEGNNIVAYANNGSKLFITESGVNSVGAAWLKTEDGYYVKASQMKYEASSKLDGAGFNGDYTIVSGNYSSQPVEDLPSESQADPVEYRITASALNVRKSAVDGDVIGTLASGTVVKVTTILSGWGKISYNGSEGWISLQYAEKVTPELTPIKVESIKLSNDLMHTGDSVECTVNVSADVACMYKFSVFNDSGEEIYSDSYHNAKNTFNFTPNTPGVYYFFVDVLSSDNRSLSGYSGNFTVYNKLQLDSVKSNIDDYAFVYEEITWTVDTVSDSDSAMYQYSVYLDGELLFERESLSSSFSYAPEKAGSYMIKVHLEDDFSSSEEIVSDAVLVYSVLSIDSVAVSETSVVTGGATVCSISASGGTGEYSYCFTVFKDNKVVKNGAYSSASESYITFSQAGTYKIFCAVKDSSNTIASAFSAEIVVLEAITGDADSDGRITAADSRLVLRYSAGIGELTASGILVSDVNRDGTVNAADARNILRCAANLEKI